MARYLGLELGDERRVAAEREVGVDPVLERGEPLLLEPRDLRLRERLVAEVGERTPAPQRERLPQLVGGGGRVAPLERLAAGVRQRGEALGVQLSGRDAQHVAAALGPQRAGLRPERAADLEDGVLERLGRRRRRGLAPQGVDQPLGRDDLVAVDQQQRDQRALPPAAQPYRRGSVDDLERTEDPVVHVRASARRYQARAETAEGMCRYRRVTAGDRSDTGHMQRLRASAAPGGRTRKEPSCSPSRASPSPPRWPPRRSAPSPRTPARSTPSIRASRTCTRAPSRDRTARPRTLAASTPWSCRSRRPRRTIGARRTRARRSRRSPSWSRSTTRPRPASTGPPRLSASAPGWRWPCSPASESRAAAAARRRSEANRGMAAGSPARRRCPRSPPRELDGRAPGGAVARVAAAGHGAVDRKHDHRSDHGADDAAEVELVVIADPEDGREEEEADERAGDPCDHGADEPHWIRARQEQATQVTGDDADDDRRDDHSKHV